MSLAGIHNIILVDGGKVLRLTFTNGRACHTHLCLHLPMLLKCILPLRAHPVDLSGRPVLLLLLLFSVVEREAKLLVSVHHL